MEETFSLKMEGQFNYDMVHFSDRKTIDQRYRLDRLEGAKAIYCLNLAATSLLHHDVLLNDPRHQSVADLICRQKSADIKFIIPQEGGSCEYDAIKYKMLESCF